MDIDSMSRIKKYELSLKVLEYLSVQKSYVLKQNIISEPSSGIGNLERYFDFTLTRKGKNELALVLQDLQEKNLIEAVFKDTQNSGNDLVITDKGKVALDKKVLDSLDEALLKIEPSGSLIEKRYGVYDAVMNKGRDWQSQTANSLVELIDGVLRTIAPKEKVDISNIDKTQKGSIRKAKISFYLSSKSKRKIVNKAFELTESVRNRLQAIKHGSKKSNAEIELLIKLTEDGLSFLLD